MYLAWCFMFSGTPFTLYNGTPCTLLGVSCLVGHLVPCIMGHHVPCLMLQTDNFRFLSLFPLPPDSFPVPFRIFPRKSSSFQTDKQQIPTNFETIFNNLTLNGWKFLTAALEMFFQKYNFSNFYFIMFPLFFHSFLFPQSRIHKQ